MSDHKFEKQVQQKMDDLKISPSDAAWEAIESGLRQGRRRRMSLWLPLLLLLFAGGAYFIFTEQNSKSPRVAPPETAVASKDQPHPNELTHSQTPDISSTDRSLNSKKPQTGPDVSVSKDVAAGSSNPSPRQHGVVASAKNKSSRPGVKISGYAGPLQKRKNARQEGTNGRPVDKEVKKVNAGTDVDPKETNNKVEGAEISRANEKPLVSAEEKDASPEYKPNVYPQVGGIAKAGQKDPAASKAVNEAEKAEKAAEKDKAVITAKRKKQAKGWQWGISAGLGVAQINDGGILDLRKTVVEDLSLSAGPNAPVSASPGPFSPSVLKPGLAFSAGVLVKKTFSKRIALSAGLTYTQYNIKSEVGTRIERSQIVSGGSRGYQNVSSFYLNNQLQEYKNRYHFIEAPVTFHLQLNRGKKLPLYWNAGASVSGLLSSNHLHFDGTTGVYYRNNDLLNKVQAVALTGFSFVLFNKRSFPLWIGPGVRYNISSLLKKDVSKSKHLLSPGIDIKLFFKK